MKNYKIILIIVFITILGFINCGGKQSGDNNTNKPGKTSVCTIDGKEIPISKFQKEYAYHIKINYPSGRQELLRDDKDAMKKYFNNQFLPKLLFIKYIKKLDVFKDPKIYEKAKEYFSKLGLVQYSIYHKAHSKYKEPDDAALKQFYKDLSQRPEARVARIIKRLKKFKWNKRRLGLLRLHKQFLINKLTMEYIEKIRQENKLIKNDDLEDKLIDKYINAKIPLNKIMSDAKNKFWLMKFNKKVISAKTVEKDVQFLVFINAGKDKLEKYMKSKKTQKSYRKLMWQQQERQWMVYLHAIKKGFDKTPDGKFFMESVMRSSLSKIYMMKKIEGKIPAPSDKEIKAMYNKLKAKSKNAPKFNAEVKNYISRQLKQRNAQKMMAKLFNRLKGRHVIIINEDYFKTAEEKDAEKSKTK